MTAAIFGLVGVFFSSRRRHTRYWRDWSSDVCSSDLGRSLGYSSDTAAGWSLEALGEGLDLAVCEATMLSHQEGTAPHMSRSEERRVGKECRSRWSPYH